MNNNNCCHPFDPPPRARSNIHAHNTSTQPSFTLPIHQNKLNKYAWTRAEYADPCGTFFGHCILTLK